MERAQGGALDEPQPDRGSNAEALNARERAIMQRARVAQAPKLMRRAGGASHASAPEPMLAAPLGFRDSRERTTRQPHGLPQQPKGDKVVFGGPNSTEETAEAWGFEGTSHRELRRVHSSLPLRWYGISAESELESEEAVVIVYGMGKDRVAETKNWAIVDVEGGPPLVSNRRHPTANELAALPPLTSPSGRAFLPTTNYLILTRLPNFVDPDFGRAQTTGSTLLVVEGVNGVGTRAAELLPTHSGLRALEDLSPRIGACEAFQALFEAFDLQAAPGGTHRFRKIRYVDSQPLPSDRGSYEAAHRQALRGVRSA